MIKKKNILITGGAGFIGFNLYLKLHKKYCIYILDFEKKIKEKPFKKNCNFIYGDISEKKNWYKILKKKIRFDYIYHLAAETSTFTSELNIKKCFKTNVMGTLNLFEYCKINKPKNIIFASSMAIYGLSSKNVSEKSIPMPISFYGLTKLNGEKILLKLKDYNINVKIFRIFNVYGVYQNYNNPHQGMLSIYLSQILRSSVVNVTGSLNRTRDFIYIDDVINALISHKILNYKLGNIFNLGSGKEISVHYLISTLFKITKKKYKVVIKDEHSGDTFNSCANISLIKKTNWKISFPLIKGINKVIKDIKYFDDNNCSFNR
jgi:UDP-glucose 4-epimerase